MKAPLLDTLKSAMAIGKVKIADLTVLSPGNQCRALIGSKNYADGGAL